MSKKYSEREVSGILRRAAEIQSSSSEEPVGDGDVTLERLTQAAAEIGIDSAAIQRAAQELLDSEMIRDKKQSAFGVSWDFDETAVAAGEITPESWPQILDQLRDVSGRVGYPSANGAGYEWLSKQPDPLLVSFTPVGDSVKVRVKAKLGGWAAAFHVVPTAAVVGIVLAIQSPLREGLHASTQFIAELVCLPALAATVGHLAFRQFSGNRKSAMRVLLKCATLAIGGSRTVEVAQGANVMESKANSAVDDSVQIASYSVPAESSEEQVLRVGE